MNNIIIQTTYPYVAEKTVMALVKGGFSATSAELNYDTSSGLPAIEDYMEYPLLITGMLDGIKTDVYIYSLTAGYSGNSANVTVHTLKTLGFSFNENDILHPNFRNIYLKLLK